MQYLEVSGAVRPLYLSLGIKGLNTEDQLSYLHLGVSCMYAYSAVDWMLVNNFSCCCQLQTYWALVCL